MGFRELYHEIVEYNGKNIFTGIIKSWNKNNNSKYYLKYFDKGFILSDEDNWEYYALSRVLDILTLRFQPNKNADFSEWIGTDISLEEYIEFIKLLGLEIIYPETYSSFNCEILEAKEGKNNFEIIECMFPTVRLKGLIIKRSGVIISINPNDYDLNLINNAKIFWAYRRKNRKHEDLSDGWGSNSQWRTDFRFDIETENHYIYNFYGEYDLNQGTVEIINKLKEMNLDVNEMIELLVNRHFIRCIKDENEIFPYSFKYSEKKNQNNGNKFVKLN